MITPPTGWTIERLPDGILIAPPEGPERALLRYAERRRPVRRAIDLAAAAPVPPGFMATATTPPRRLTTIEGEHAALITRTGTLASGAAATLVYGYVFLDDYYAALEGITFADMTATIEELVIGDVHLLGRERRRRCVYTPPAGWQGRGNLFEARWFPLDYPANPASIFVNPALPNTPGLARAILEKLGGAFTLERFKSRQGLDGEHHQRGDTHVFFLTDEEFLYSVRVDIALEIGRTLVDTIEPVPRPVRPVVDELRFWVD